MTTDHPAASSPLDGSVLERIIDLVAADEQFRDRLRTEPYQALLDLGIAAAHIDAIRDATIASQPVAPDERTAAQTTWGKLMRAIDARAWTGER